MVFFFFDNIYLDETGLENKSKRMINLFTSKHVQNNDHAQYDKKLALSFDYNVLELYKLIV